MTGEGMSFNHGENEMREYSVTEIPPMGFGNPDASIAYNRFEDEQMLPVIKRAVEILVNNPPICDITDFDDGCMDGRIVDALLFLLGIEGEDFNKVEVTNPGEHQRAKLAGGGYITSLAMNIGLRGSGVSVDLDIKNVTEDLAKHNIFCGIHTGDHAKEGGVDCGACDQLPDNLMNMSKYKDKIAETISFITDRFLPNIKFSDENRQTVEDNIARLDGQEGYFKDSNGETRFDVIMSQIAAAQINSGDRNKPLAVSKNLAGTHTEAFVVLNLAGDGTTFSQDAFQKQLASEFPDIEKDKLPKVFVVDVHRIIKLAKAVADSYGPSQNHFMTALYAGLSFQFAVAAQLTDGSLRTFVIQ